jgi:putative cell wall-binding protein
VAALTGVTLFGGLSIVGAGVASAATPTVSAAITTGSSATTISGSGATQAAANLTLTVNGVIAANDQITLTIACPTTGTAAFTAAPTVTTTGTANWSAGAPGSSNGCSTETLTAGAADTSGSSTIALTGINITTSGVSSQALAVSGTYATLGSVATSFTVPTIATVAYYNVTSNTPAVTLPASGTTALSQIQIVQPTNLKAADFLSGAAPTTFATVANAASGDTFTTITETGSHVANQVINKATATQTFTVAVAAGGHAVTSVTASGLPAGMALSTAAVAVPGTGTASLTGTPTTAGSYPVTITANDGTSTPATAKFTLVVNPAVVTLTLGSTDTWSGSPTLVSVPSTNPAGSVAINGTNAHELDITVTSQPAAGFSGTWTVSGLSVVTANAAVGSHTAAVNYTNVAGSTATAVMGTIVVGNVLGSVTTIYGADGTADGTVAAEFENAYPASANNASSGNRNVVLATDAPHANGSDALAASYLEGTLNTGLLITSPTSLGADAQQAMQLEGVTTVYVVGGPLAISPAVIAQIKALPAYNPGGLTTTGSNIQVVGPIYGSDGTAEGTAAAIATRYGTAYGSASFPAAYTSSGLGVYNTSTGMGSTTAPSGVVPTAVVVASSDWQDAMSIAPEAFKMRFPVILAGPSTSTTLGADASAALTSLGVKQVIVVGGQLALQNSVEAQIAALNGGISVLRIAGIDATDTAAQIANFALAQGTAGLGWTAGNHAVLASHVDYWTDALGAAALGGGANSSFGTEPIILVQNPTTVGKYTTAELTVLGGLTAPAGPVYNLTVLGGPLAMPSSTVQTLLAGL